MELRLLNADETKTEKDEAGNELVLVGRITRRQWELLEEAVKADQMSTLKDMGISLDAAYSKAQEKEKDEKAEKKATTIVDYSSPEVRRLKLKIIVVSLKVGGQVFEGADAVLDVYENKLDNAGADWIDEKVNDVWRGSEVSKTAKK